MGESRDMNPCRLPLFDDVGVWTRFNEDDYGVIAAYLEELAAGGYQIVKVR